MGAGVLRPGILPLLPGSMMFPPFMVIVTFILPLISGKVNPGPGPAGRNEEEKL